MKKFKSYIKNEQYAIGCTGTTVYVYDLEGNELARFKDLQYGYNPMFNPVRNEFIVKSTDGRLAYYSLDEMRLIKKFRFSKVDGSQDDSFCFSKDGALFYNLERHIVSYNSGLSVYDVNDFSVVRTFAIEDENLRLHDIQCDYETGEIYLLGEKRDDSENENFAAILGRDGLEKVAYISESVADYYHWSISLEISGFTDYAFEWTPKPPKEIEYKPVQIKDLVDEYDFDGYYSTLREHEELLDLSYYNVPENAVVYETWQQKLQAVADIENWSQINMGDTDYKDGKSIGEYVDCIGELMWQLKLPDEKLVFKAKTSKLRNQYREVLLLNAIEAAEEVGGYLGQKFAFIYEKDNLVRKIITVSTGEIVECYYLKDIEAEVQGVFSKWATETEYYKYELKE